MFYLTRRFVLMQDNVSRSCRTTSTTTIGSGLGFRTPSWTDQHQLGLFSGSRVFFCLPPG